MARRPSICDSRFNDMVDHSAVRENCQPKATNRYPTPSQHRTFPEMSRHVVVFEYSSFTLPANYYPLHQQFNQIVLTCSNAFDSRALSICSWLFERCQAVLSEMAHRLPHSVPAEEIMPRDAPKSNARAPGWDNAMPDQRD